MGLFTTPSKFTSTSEIMTRIGDNGLTGQCRRFRVYPPQDRLDASHRFPGRKRLADVIVSPEFQPRNIIDNPNFFKDQLRLLDGRLLRSLLNNYCSLLTITNC